MDDLIIDVSVKRCKRMRQNSIGNKECSFTKLKKVYVVSRLKGNICKNLKLAKAYCKYVDKLGFMPVASHIMYPAMGFDDTNPIEREKCRMYGLELLKCCDMAFCFVKDGVISSGMHEEIRVARHLNIPLRFYKVSEDGCYECSGNCNY